MYGQYSAHTLQIHFKFQIFIDTVSIWFISMKIFRYYCSSNSNHLVQIENWTRCDVWTIFSPRCTNTLWISNFHCNCIYIFYSMKMYQILLQLQLKLFCSNRKLNLLWCMDYIQYTFYKYTLSLKFSLILYLHVSFQWRFFRYFCSSNWNHSVQIENWIYCNVWTIFSTRCTNTLWISNFHCNCISIFNSMISIRYYCSSNSIFFVEFENYIYCDVWTIFSLRCTNTHWISNFHWYCIYVIHLNEYLWDIWAAPTQTI